MKKSVILKEIKIFLEARLQMVIATSGKHPWIATVYYSVDKDLNIYFLSDPKTLHCKQIAKNPRVAISIADSPQPSSSKKKGLQIYGIAKQIKNKQEVILALNLWKKTLNVANPNYTHEGMLKNKIKGRMYKITPKLLKFFNEELWKEGTEPVINL